MRKSSRININKLNFNEVQNEMKNVDQLPEYDDDNDDTSCLFANSAEIGKT